MTLDVRDGVATRRICGTVATCNRPPGHRGHHGGFRPANLIRAEVPGVRLGPREIEVLRVYARVASHKIIAAELDMSIQTVKNHLHAIYRKLDVSTGIQAFAALGWLRIPNDEDLAIDDDLARTRALRASLSAIATEAAAIAGRLDASTEQRP